MTDTITGHEFLEFAAGELGSVVVNELCRKTMGSEDRAKAVNRQSHGSRWKWNNLQPLGV